MARVMTCPYCGARFEVPETVAIAVCPYCGTTVWQATGETFREHYFYEDRIGFSRAFDNVRRIAQRQFAAPEDVAEASTPKAGYLHFIPLYLYHVRVKASCPGAEEAGLEEEYNALLAAKRVPEGFPENYKFPTRGRKYFEPETLERGRYYQPEVDPKELLSKASEKARRRALREALNHCDNPEIRDETRWIGIIHYPIWEVTYSYNGRDYRALVDAAEGTVLYLEYPIGGKERGILLGLTAGTLLAGLGLGALVGGVLDHLTAGAAGGLIAALPGSYTSLRLGAARVGRYRYSPA